MREIFKKDITIKVGAVLIAILFWLFVYNNSNPYVTMPFYNIPLKLVNEAYLTDNGYIIKNKYKSTIDVTIRGRQEAVSKVRSSDFEAFLDFSQIKSLDDKTLKIDGPYCSINDVDIVAVQPSAIEIQLARKKSSSFSVELVNNITLKPGYKILKTTVSPETITINDEEAVIDSVRSIKAVLDLKDVDRSTTKKVNCKVYSDQGRELTGMSRNLSVDVSIEVGKEVPVTLVTKGRLSQEYVETMRLVTPDKVLITGPPEQLARISEIKTEPLDIDNLSQNLNAVPVIKLPAGIKFAETQKEVAVSIMVEKLAVKDISIQGSDVKQLNGVEDGTLKYEILSSDLQLQLKGRMADLNGINAVSLLPEVDLAGLTEGTHKVRLNITLPQQVKLMQDVFVEVKVTKAENPPG